jgi:hypothetical protein
VKPSLTFYRSIVLNVEPKAGTPSRHIRVEYLLSVEHSATIDSGSNDASQQQIAPAAAIVATLVSSIATAISSSQLSSEGKYL